ncbi:hypothetical protein IBE11_03785 [Francisella tularensis subsp. novicida]|uniref:P-loop NTPase fold protein n=1 Tax=Francisella tularensis TaxID=263 RepID=UPI000505E689|nr:P-loop NTPase fold protein [Francisella tularensis]AJJ47581.1 KAP family P-loop domain protein [Francisella tularensis subsp. novicida]KFJ66774.1 KAP family P-loop domain protein [Francisella tularensis subsp. novicida]MBK2344836.1 hypothetical protein [Francisella tularensis subsp. novicida]MBK2349594.1 hypothetical protein [Francisella tularensis subsp. novicida]MBK2353154.1 hypothetical protein [Francisella tularensis subsp. novicida]
MKNNDLENSLKELLKRKDALCISINGEWGVGKTFFWNKFVDSNFSTLNNSRLLDIHKKDIKTFDWKVIIRKLNRAFSENSTNAVYVSLFGKDSLQEIREDLLQQVFKSNNIISKIKNKFGTFNYNGLSASSLLSCLEKKDFDNIIVCFDDFERLSEKLSLKDVFGLMSELKEQKNCHVVMILNREKLGKDNCLSEYKDKIIDYELKYNPSSGESFELVRDELNAFENYALEFFHRFKINNVRIMKRVINALNDYASIKEIVGNHIAIEKIIVTNILQIATINAFGYIDNYDEFQMYTYDKKSNTKNENYDKALDYLDNDYKYFQKTGITNNIIEYVKNSVINKDELKTLIEEEIGKIEYSNIQDNIQNLINRSRNDLQYSNIDYANDLFSLLKDNEKNLINFVNSDSFLLYINDLINFDSENTEKYKDFAISILKKYLDVLVKSKSNFSFGTQIIEKIIKFDPKLEGYYFGLKDLNEKEVITNKDSVLNLMLKPLERHGWNPEDCILLSKVDIKDLKKYLLEDYEFMRESRNFIDWVNRFTNPSGFEEYRDNLIKAMNELKEELKDNQKNKLENILENFNRIAK